MKKKAFSYLELIFAMIIIVVLMFMTLPLITRSAKKQSLNVFGEYRCYIKGNQFFEQSRFNNDNLSEPKQVNSCIFSRPTGATAFKITLIGGGGAGNLQTTAPTFVYKTLEDNMPSVSFNDANGNAQINNITNPFGTGPLSATTLHLHISGKDVIYTHPNTGTSFIVNGFTPFRVTDAIRTVPNRGGEAGSVHTISIPAENMPFDNNGQIEINKSATSTATIFNTGIRIAQPSAGNGYSTFIKTTVKNGENLPNDICVHNSTSTLCQAKGGNQASNTLIDTDLENISATVGAKYTIIPGKDGGYDSRVAASAGPAGTGSTCAPDPTKPTTTCLSSPLVTELGAGSGGPAKAISISSPANYTFQEYHILKMYRTINGQNVYLNDNYNLYLQGTPPKSIPTFNAQIQGNIGQSGGGGIIIEW